MSDRLTLTNGQLVYIALYLVLMIAYLFSETSGSFRRRAVNKIVLSAMFVLYAIHALLHRAGITAQDEIELAAILFSFAGDCCLLWNFAVGGAVFTIGNVLFILYELLLANSAGVLGLLPWALIPFALLWGGYWLLAKRGILKGAHDALFVKYLASPTAHGCLGLVLALVLPAPRATLFGIGLVLFMLSDYLLGFFHYHHYARTTKWVQRVHSTSYFLGMLLVALSMGL